MLNIDDRLIKEVSPKIGANALSVLLAIAIHLNQKTNRAFPSHHRLMELTGLGRDAVYNALEKLKAEKLLTVEQKIDSKTKQFGRRTFKLSTRFIKIFVDALDMEPLPENPDTAHPDTAHPDTENQETYQLNNLEQLNKLEQINKGKHAPAQIQFSDVPKFITPTELEERLREFYKAYPEEWNTTLETARHEYFKRGQKFDADECKSAVASYCEWVIEETKMRYKDFGAHNARLRRWLRDQASMSVSKSQPTSAGKGSGIQFFTSDVYGQ